MNGNLYPIREGGKWGYIDRQGAVVVAPQYSCAHAFSDGLARVWVGSRCGYLDLNGAMVIEPGFDSASDFEQGRAVVREEEQWLVIDRLGKIVNPIPYRVLGDYHAGLCLVEKFHPTAFGYIDREGAVAIEPQFLPAGDFPDDGIGLAAGGLDNQWCYFDHRGTIVFRVPMGPNPDAANPFRDGLVRVKDGFYWGYKNPSGEWAIEPRFDDARDFDGGIAHVQLDGRWTTIDRSGNEAAVDWRKRPIAAFSEGLALASGDGLFGWIDASWSPAFPFRKYDKAFSFHCGLARIRVDGRFGYLDRAGNPAIPVQFCAASDFDHDLAWVMAEDRECYIDVRGRFVWQGAPPPKIALQAITGPPPPPLTPREPPAPRPAEMEMAAPAPSHGTALVEDFPELPGRDYLVDTEFRGETIHYIEKERRCSMDFTWTQGYRIHPDSITDWTTADGKAPMTDEERRMVVARLVKYAREVQGVALIVD